MKKTSLLTTFLCAFAVSCMAQLNLRPQIVISGDAGGRVAHQYGEHSTVFGGALGYKYPVSANVALGLSAGYTSYITAYKTVGGDIIMRTTLNAIPLKAGVRYYLYKGLFAEGELGAAIGTNEDARNAFLYTPGVGYQFVDGFGFGLRYESWIYKKYSVYNKVEFNQVAFRLSYAF